jgi:Ser-tRNA(Ala) deacylase AlaX
MLDQIPRSSELSVTGEDQTMEDLSTHRIKNVAEMNPERSLTSATDVQAQKKIEKSHTLSRVASGLLNSLRASFGFNPDIFRNLA